MLNIPENKPRKRLRVTLCVLYLLEIVFCSFTFFQVYDGKNIAFKTVFDMLGEQLSKGDVEIKLAYALFLVIPTIGFFFCALDKEKNLKNVVSIFLALAGVVCIIYFVGLPCLSIGSLLALLVYFAISFLSAMSILARFVKDPPKEEKKPASTSQNYER